MQFTNRVLFRSVLRQFYQHFSSRMNRKQRRLFDRLLDDESLMDVVFLQFRSQMPVEESDEDDPVPNPNPTPRPTPILDKFGQMFKWLIEHQEQVLAFIEALMEIIIGVISAV